jgi:hypothetical protein
MRSYRTFPLVGPIDNASTLSKAASAQNSSVIRMKKSVRLARIPSHKGDNDGNMASIWTPACARHWS